MEVLDCKCNNMTGRTKEGRAGEYTRRCEMLVVPELPTTTLKMLKTARRLQQMMQSGAATRQTGGGVVLLQTATPVGP